MIALALAVSLTQKKCVSAMWVCVCVGDGLLILDQFGIKVDVGRD